MNDYVRRVTVTANESGFYNVVARWASGVGEILAGNVGSQGAAEILAGEFEEGYGLREAA